MMLGYYSTKTERVYDQLEITNIFGRMIDGLLEYIAKFQKES